jgi:hypothetical protein
MMNIIGHEKERQSLREAVEKDIVTQSYLFSGPRGIGKSLCALEFAALLSGEPDFESTEEKRHPFDVMILRPSEETKNGVTKRKNISAEAVRDGIAFLSHFPGTGKFRVLLIEDAHKLSETAQNVLLKTLEEPRSTAVIILVTHETGSILPTVLSRVKRIPFHFVPEKRLKEALQARFSEKELSDIAPFFFALGRPGMVLEALTDPETFVTERELLGKLFRLSTLSLSERLTLAETLGTHADRAVRLLEWWLPGLYQQALQIKEKKGTVRFFQLLQEIEQTLRQLKTTQSNTRLLLEKLFLAV